MWFFVVLLVLGMMVLALFINGSMEIARKEKEKRAAMSPHELQLYIENEKAVADTRRRAKEERRRQASDTFNHGPINPMMVCQHCNTRGQIRTKGIVNKKGVSGGKATAAVLTGGISLLATGLSRKEAATQARCGTCRNTWSF
jgi:membrane glycosyltransferase